ncbi:hypothetical protein BESB_072680 [Besnoitia besnoiti]|uniref:Sulfite exporter TauE/SafE protein n=1 Tax=Besnoitia besnoiti TaxID=94643 RepID=A0A2A9MDU0_BESBE|nr:uncharacterized protein BESB_072680 [Besnoitia besnoiti]PFH34116.1 hypothetical protein BESB_072680 [Besnoitia besnoiti]
MRPLQCLASRRRLAAVIVCLFLMAIVPPLSCASRPPGSVPPPGFVSSNSSAALFPSPATAPQVGAALAQPSVSSAEGASLEREPDSLASRRGVALSRDSPPQPPPADAGVQGLQRQAGVPARVGGPTGPQEDPIEPGAQAAAGGGSGFPRDATQGLASLAQPDTSPQPPDPARLLFRHKGSAPQVQESRPLWAKTFAGADASGATIGHTVLPASAPTRQISRAAVDLFHEGALTAAGPTVQPSPYTSPEATSYGGEPSLSRPTSSDAGEGGIALSGAGNESAADRREGLEAAGETASAGAGGAPSGPSSGAESGVSTPIPGERPAETLTDADKLAVSRQRLQELIRVSNQEMAIPEVSSPEGSPGFVLSQGSFPRMPPGVAAGSSFPGPPPSSPGPASVDVSTGSLPAAPQQVRPPASTARGAAEGLAAPLSPTRNPADASSASAPSSASGASSFLPPSPSSASSGGGAEGHRGVLDLPGSTAGLPPAQGAQEAYGVAETSLEGPSSPPGKAEEEAPPVLPHSSFISVALLLQSLFVFASLAAAGGIGGGSVFVALLVGLGHMHLSYAIPISKVMVFSSSFSSFLLNRKLERQTAEDARAVAQDWVDLLVPLALSGSLVGVLLNTVLPALYLLLLLSVLLLGLSVRTIASALRIWRSEREASAQQPFDEVLLPSPTTSPRGGASAAAAPFTPTSRPAYLIDSRLPPAAAPHAFAVTASHSAIPPLAIFPDDAQGPAGGSQSATPASPLRYPPSVPREELRTSSPSHAAGTESGGIFGRPLCGDEDADACLEASAHAAAVDIAVVLPEEIDGDSRGRGAEEETSGLARGGKAGGRAFAANVDAAEDGDATGHHFAASADAGSQLGVVLARLRDAGALTAAHTDGALPEGAYRINESDAVYEDGCALPDGLGLPFRPQMQRAAPEEKADNDGEPESGGRGSDEAGERRPAAEAVEEAGGYAQHGSCDARGDGEREAEGTVSGRSGGTAPADDGEAALNGQVSRSAVLRAPVASPCSPSAHARFPRFYSLEDEEDLSHISSFVSQAEASGAALGSHLSASSIFTSSSDPSDAAFAPSSAAPFSAEADGETRGAFSKALHLLRFACEGIAPSSRADPYDDALASFSAASIETGIDPTLLLPSSGGASGSDFRFGASSAPTAPSSFVSTEHLASYRGVSDDAAGEAVHEGQRERRARDQGQGVFEGPLHARSSLLRATADSSRSLLRSPAAALLSPLTKLRASPVFQKAQKAVLEADRLCFQGGAETPHYFVLLLLLVVNVFASSLLHLFRKHENLCGAAVTAGVSLVLGVYVQARLSMRIFGKHVPAGAAPAPPTRQGLLHAAAACHAYVFKAVKFGAKQAGRGLRRLAEGGATLLRSVGILPSSMAASQAFLQERDSTRDSIEIAQLSCRARLRDAGGNPFVHAIGDIQEIELAEDGAGPEGLALDLSSLTGDGEGRCAPRPLPDTNPFALDLGPPERQSARADRRSGATPPVSWCSLFFTGRRLSPTVALPPLFVTPAVGFFTGVFAGLIGIGGGVVFSPFLLLMGSDPVAAVATASACVVFTSASTSLQFLLIGRLPLLFASLFGVVAAAAAATATCGIHRFRRAVGGRMSVIAACVALAVTVASVLTMWRCVETAMFGGH